jgi:exodeoxyribonuclease-3|tara:strand:- start:5446 stop:6174 length:729 start_codon:yes stop_codon:yes gene_type:complete
VFENVEEEKRFNKIAEFIKKEKPNMLVLSEVGKWKNNFKNRLKKFKVQTKFPYHFQKNHILFFSQHVISCPRHIKDAIIKINTVINDEKITVIASHLSPDSEDKRLSQVEAIIKNINNEDKVILIGDLNSLSPLDNYDEQKLFNQLKKINIIKFGEDKLRKDVQKKILNFGLIDTVREFSKKFEYSVPTLFNKDINHFSKLRLDYLYITLPLKPFLKSAKIIRNDETNQLSDHFPIIAEFNL